MYKHLAPISDENLDKELSSYLSSSEEFSVIHFYREDYQQPTVPEIWEDNAITAHTPVSPLTIPNVVRSEFTPEYAQGDDWDKNGRTI